MTTPTQGEHAQTEALRLAHYFDQPLPPEWEVMKAAAAELRRLHAENRVLKDANNNFALAQDRLSAQVAALTAQPAASVENPMHQHLLDMLGAKDHEDAARIIAGHHARELTAQPAAPQGVAYAELPEPVYQWTDGTRTLHQDVVSAIRDYAGSKPEEGENWESWFEAAFDLLGSRVNEIFEEHAMRASHGQAPACKGSAGECTFNGACMYACGAAPAGAAEQTGYCRHYAPCECAPEARESCVSWRRYPPTTAQAAPAAGAVTGPVLFVSREQLEGLLSKPDPEAEHGRYLPIRRVSAGKFTHPLYAAPTPAAQADSVLEDAARKAIDKVLALFPFNAPIQTFTIGGGPHLTADGDTEFYSAKRIWALLREVKTTLDAARKQGGA